MKGMRELIAARMNGVRPVFVMLDDGRFDQEFPEFLALEEGDVPERADLRALIGLTVVVSMRDRIRTERWARAVMAARAKTVMAGVYEANLRTGEGRLVTFEVLRREGVDQ